MILNYLDKEVYIEIHGKSSNKNPLVMLNGIMMSCLSWKAFINRFSKDRELILIDFFDQGKSSSYQNPYNHSLQVDLVLFVLKTLKRKKYDLFGISYGAQVALELAIKDKKNLIDKLLIFNGTSKSGKWLTDIGKAWMIAASNYDPLLFYHVSIPYIYSEDFYNKNEDFMMDRKKLLLQVFDKTFLNRQYRLIKSSEDYDISEDLDKIENKTLIVSSDNDYITPKESVYKLTLKIKDNIYHNALGSGHALMYEKPEEFAKLILDFI